MLQLSPAQLQSAGALAHQRFIDRVVDRVTERFGEQAERLGTAGVRQAVEAAVDRGRARGLESEHDLFLFTCLAFAFGARFDEDPRIAWAGATLDSRVLGSPSDRIERAYELALAATAQSGRPWVPLPPLGEPSGR